MKAWPSAAGIHVDVSSLGTDARMVFKRIFPNCVFDNTRGTGWLLTKTPQNAASLLAFAYDHGQSLEDPGLRSLALAITDHWSHHNGTLRPYQHEGIVFLASRRRAILADFTGAGKSCQSLLAVEAVGAYPCLVMCPTGSVHQWVREAHKWLPGTRKVVGYPNPPADGKTPQADVYVSPWSAVGRSPPVWRSVILDEAHRARNKKTQAFIEATYACATASYVFALTATPIVNRVLDILNLSDILRRCDDLGGYWPAVKLYTAAKKKVIGRDPETGELREAWDTKGSAEPEVLEDLTRRMKPYYLRRTEEEVKLQLPPCTRSVVEVDLSNRASYDQAAKKAVQWFLENQDEWDSINALSLLSSLRYHTALGKTEAAIEKVQDKLEEDSTRKVVVFYFHNEARDAIAEDLGVESLELHGGLSSKQRDTVVSRFQSDPSRRVLLANVRSASESVSFTAADYVLFLEPWWNKAQHDQAIGRLNRFGQSKPVLAEFLLARGTVDEHVWSIVESKAGLMDMVTDGFVARRIVERLVGA